MKTIASMAVALWGLLGAGCARQTAVVSTPPAPKATAVSTVMRRQVLNAADAGEGDTLAAQWRRQLASDPLSVEPRLALAAHYRKTGRPELELEHLRVAVERFPSSREARLALAASLRGAGEPADAAAALQELLALQPAAADDPAVLNQLGIAYDEAGDWRRGEQAFRRAVALAPKLDYLHNNLGYNLFQQQRVPEAVPALQQAVKLNPRSETARNNLGMAVARWPGAAVGDALKHFENVTDAATANSNLAAALIEQQRYGESRRLLEAALDYNRSHAAALANLRLLSELDGKPLTVPLRPRVGPVRRSLAVLKKIFVPPKGDTP